MATQSITINRPKKKKSKMISFWSLGAIFVFVLFLLGSVGKANPLSYGAITFVLLTAVGSRHTFASSQTHWARTFQLGFGLIIGLHILAAIEPRTRPLILLLLVAISIVADRKSLSLLLGFSILCTAINYLHAHTTISNLALDGGFMILFALSASIMSHVFEIKKKLFKSDEELDSEKLKREARELHLHTLSETTSSRERTREVVDRHAIRAVNQSVFLSLSLLKTGLQCHSVVLLWLDVSQKKLRIKELLSDSDNIIEGEISPAKGVIGGITRRRESLKLDQIREGFRGLPYYRNASNKVKSFVGIPVLEHGHLRGVICVDRIIDTPFSEKDVQVLQEASEYIVRTIENERLFSEIEKSKYELGRFFDASRRLNSVLTTKEALETTLECIKDIVPFDFAAITTNIDNDGHQIVAAVGSLEEHLGKRFYNNKGLVSMVTRNRHYLPYGGKVRDGKTVVFSEEIPVPDVRSILVLPLIAQDQCVGTLIVGHSKAGIYTSERREMLEVVANQAAVTFANAKLYERMHELATTDGLTGLANHRTFQTKTDEAIARHKRSKKSFCLLLTDIDHFKNVNDTHGHPAGDEVLRQFADAFRKTLRETDTPCRYGGEEFAIILEDTDTEGAMLIANKVREAVKALEFESEEGGKFNCSLSIGVATWPDDAMHKQALIDLADKALYYSKENGRDRVSPVSDLSPKTS